MPAALSYPGVYIEELPSGVRTITGVPTSIAAFVGATASGPLNKPVRITSQANFLRRFGPTSADTVLGRVITHYYQNGGSEAFVVRVAPAAGGPTAAALKLTDKVNLLARYPGAAGNSIRLRVDRATRAPKDDKLYNLTIRDLATGTEERYLNIRTGGAGADSLPRMLAASELVMVDPAATGEMLATAPTPSPEVKRGDDPWAAPPVPAAALVAPGTPASPATPATPGTPATPAVPAVPAVPPPPNSIGPDDKGQGSEGTAVALGPDDYIGTPGGSAPASGMQALRDETIFFNMLCIPATQELDGRVWAEAAKLCLDRRAMLIVDPPPGAAWGDPDSVEKSFRGDATAPGKFDGLGAARRNAALYFPRLVGPGEDGPRSELPICGVVAGIWARTDVQRGVWKAPAGTDAAVTGPNDVAVPLNNLENGTLNVLGINCLRRFPVIGTVVWGARTLEGADELTSQWKYLPIRRLALFLEESLFRGSQWIVFEPNDEPLWAQIRLNFGAFMHTLFRQGAFQGTTPKDAYFVKCDSETTTQNDRDRGVVNIVVGFAPLKPAEFVVIQLQQMAGLIET